MLADKVLIESNSAYYILQLKPALLYERAALSAHFIFTFHSIMRLNPRVVEFHQFRDLLCSLRLKLVLNGRHVRVSNEVIFRSP
jgi:hypothetical protein